MGVNPAGKVSVTVTVPLVAFPLLPTVNVKLPVDPRVNVDELAILVRVSRGNTSSATETVTVFWAPPPLAVAVFVHVPCESTATTTRTVILG